MAGKALNKKNLEALGAETLAELLMEAVKGDAARQRRVRMALSSEQSPREAAADIRKRLAQLRRAKSWISARGQRSLAKELAGLIDLVETRIGPEDAGLGFDLLWSLLHIAPNIYGRTDDSSGTIGAVMDGAMDAIQRLAPRLEMAPDSLAEQVFEALLDDGYGAFDAAILALSEALGEAGLSALKVKATAALDAPAGRAGRARESRERVLRMILKDVADAQDDVEAWLGQYSSEQLTFHTIAPDAARRLLAAGRAEDALEIMENCLKAMARKERWFDTPEVDSAHFACLETLGREAELRRAMWARFEERLCAETLRRYLSRLPDFEDDEALHAAQVHVRGHPNMVHGLIFCLQWPDPVLAADLVLSRCDELDGNDYDLLTHAADLLEAEHPLAAALVWRAMITFALENARAKRCRHAARHLASCAAVDLAITDYGDFESHEAYLDKLRRAHLRKFAFWEKVSL